MLSILLLEQIAQLFLIMLLGFLVVRARVLTSEDSRILSMILLYVVTPCVIVSSFQIERTADTVRMLELSCLSAIILSLLTLLLGQVFSKMFHMDLVETASVMYPNCTNLVIPVVSAVFGPSWIMFVTIYSMVQSFLSWTHGWMMISGQKKFSLKMLFGNVNILAIIVGLFLFFTQIRMPAVMLGAFDKINGVIGPIAMLIVGMLLADLRPADLKSYRSIWKPVLLRLVVLPVILVLVEKYSGLAALARDGETVLLVSLLSAIAPSANIVPQFCQMFDRDARYASLINAVTMILCIVTIPLMVALYQL